MTESPSPDYVAPATTPIVDSAPLNEPIPFVSSTDLAPGNNGAQGSQSPVPDLSKLVLPKGLRIKNNHVTIAPRFASRKNRGAQAGAFGRPKHRD